MEAVMEKPKTKKKKQQTDSESKHFEDDELVYQSVSQVTENNVNQSDKEKVNNVIKEDQQITTISNISRREIQSESDLNHKFNKLLILNKNRMNSVEQEQSKINIEKAIDMPLIIRPYTESQLAAFYINTELDTLELFTTQFIEAELKGLSIKQHHLYELLTNYLQIRQRITGNNLELEQLRKEYKDLQMNLWTIDTALITGRGECHDGSTVIAKHSYQRATFHRSIFQSIVRNLGLIRKLTYENHILYSYSAEDLRLQIELYIQNAINCCINMTQLSPNAPVYLSFENEPINLKPYLSEIRLCISVLFAFQRKLILDIQFLNETRQWLNELIAVLLRLATYQDHLFILNHILRCPSGVGQWTASYIQTPLDDDILNQSPFSSYQINHILSILTIILSPIKERDKFLDDLLQSREGNNNDSLWIMVDSDGEEDDDESGNSLRENDLVDLLTQLPLENLFRNLLLIDKRNLEYHFDISKINENYLLKFISFSTILLNILNKGLNTYNKLKYNQFNKRLSRLIRHIVQYVTDLWEIFKINIKISDKAMMERLQVEYDSFFLRAIYYLYKSKKSGAWQFLAVIPYNLIKINTIWKIYYFLHNLDELSITFINNLIDDNDYYNNKIWDQAFRDEFDDKLILLADDELYYLLNTFANMALARDTTNNNDHDNNIIFIKESLRDLLNIGFISLSTQELCSKTARTLITHITSKYSYLLSFILIIIKDNIKQIDTLALYLYEELPLKIWKLTDDDLKLLSNMLINNSIMSIESKLVRMILSRLNWDILPYEIHCDVALLILKSIDNDLNYCQWAWQTIFRLKLHINDKAFNNINRILDPDNYDIIVKGIREQQPLASFILLLMTSWGHLIPLINTYGLNHILLLQVNQKYEAVLFLLYLIVPLFINCQESLINCDKYQEILINLINADRNYISMAKSLISVQTSVLQQFGNMIETQIVNYNLYEQIDSPRCLVRLWINSLISIPNWNKDINIMYLLDVIIRASFFHSDALDVIRNIFKDLLQLNLNQEQNGITSILKWVSSSTTPTLINVSLTNYTWLAYIIIDIEFDEREKKTGLWMEILKELNKQKSKTNVDSAIKKAANNLKLQTFTSNYLCIYRWIQQAIDTPMEHPLLPLLWQKFFLLYLTRIPIGLSNDKSCVGDKFFDGFINFSCLKRIKKLLSNTVDFYQEKLTNAPDDKKQFLQLCLEVFRAFSLWLEEPRLQETNLLLQLLPPQYKPNLLALIIQNISTPWYEYLDYDQIKLEQLECIKIWKISNFRYKSNINQPLLNPGKSPESTDPIERILRRLKVYETPKLPPNIKIKNSLITTIDFSNNKTMFHTLETNFNILKQFAHNHTLKLSEHKVLDCTYQELIPQLYRSVLNKITKKIPCRGRNDTVNCSGAAVIVLEMHEARINERIQHQIESNRNTYESLLSQSLQIPALALCIASVTLQQTIKILQSQIQCNPATGELGIELFYYILSLINEETINYLPTKNLFSLCLEKLGQSHICGVEYEMPRLLDRILKEPNLGGYLAPHFLPTNIGSTNLLFMYSTICQQINNYDVTFTLLSKFDINNWLLIKNPLLNQRSEFIKLIIKSLTTLGFEPKIETLALHNLYRKHLLSIFQFQFPEHYGEILVCSLKASNGNTENNLLSINVWYDILNYLSKPIEFNIKLPLRDQFRQYAQNQKILQHQELLETCELFSKHFTNERLQYGLYGLYPKNRHYIDIFTILLGMNGHGLIISMINTHQGLLGDKLVEKIWPYLISIYTPWIVPYSMQNIKDNMAIWIQQLADDRSILLPWIHTDENLAKKIILTFYECIHFIITTLPASAIIFSYVWQWYVKSYAHTSVKSFILNPIHYYLISLPWNNFWPTIIDIELMLRVINQYLPDCHTFLGHIFMQISWTNWIKYFDQADKELKGHIYHCYLNLLIKLSNEPNCKDNYDIHIKSLINDIEQLDWYCLEAKMFQNIIDWYTMSCDSNVLYKTDSNDLDLKIFNLLKTASEYNKPTNNLSSDLSMKRLIFVKTIVKLLSVSVSRNKNQLKLKQNDISIVIIRELEHLEFVVKSNDELMGLLQELTDILNIDGIQQIAILSFIKWIENKPSDSCLIKNLLQIIEKINNLEALSIILETLLTTYFQNNIGNEYQPSWYEIGKLMNITLDKHKKLEEILLNNGHVLSLNAIFTQHMIRSTNIEVLLNLVIDWLPQIKINEFSEPKIPLLLSGILKLSLVYCEFDENTTGIILYKFAKNLLQLSEEKNSSRWGRSLLGVIGLAKQETISINFRFLCKALAGYVMAQLPDMKGELQVVRHKPNAPAKVGQSGGNSECAKILMNLNFGQNQMKIKECEELVLNQIQDSNNSMHNATKFLSLVVKQFYIKSYLKDIA